MEQSKNSKPNQLNIKGKSKAKTTDFEQKIRKKKYRILTTSLGLFITAIIVCASLYIPKLIFDSHTKSEANQIKEVPYSSYVAYETSLSKKLSEELAALDRIKLISNEWPSTYNECNKEEGFISELEAVRLAKSGIEKFYKAGCYYASLESNFDNWYSWETKLYKYSDTTFNTYTAYLWQITFIKYDNTCSHTILMTENGTILNAECNKQNEPAMNPVLYAYVDITTNKSLLLDILNTSEHILLQNYSDYKNKLTISYPDVDITNADVSAYILSIKKNYSENEDYIIYRYYKNNRYGIGITSAK